MLWQRRIDHLHLYYLKHLFPNLFKNKSPSSFSCEVCQLAKFSCQTLQRVSSFLPNSYWYLGAFLHKKVSQVYGGSLPLFMTTRVCKVYLLKRKILSGKNISKIPFNDKKLVSNFHSNLENWQWKIKLSFDPEGLYWNS